MHHLHYLHTYMNGFRFSILQEDENDQKDDLSIIVFLYYYNNIKINRNYKSHLKKASCK